MMGRIAPKTAIASNNFYFLVKTCGVSPLEIPHMTPFQVEVLIQQHNKHVKKEKEEIEKQKKEIEKMKSKRPRR